MMTVLLDCAADANALGISLGALVPGAIDGLVREVVVIDRGMDDGARKVADHAGCRVVPAAGFRAAIAGAKGEWLMLIEPGSRLSPGWIESVCEHLADVSAGKTPRAARFTRAKDARPGFLNRLRRGRTLEQGLILPKAQGVALSARRDTLEDAARGLASAVLAATIRPRVDAPTFRP